MRLKSIILFDHYQPLFLIYLKSGFFIFYARLYDVCNIFVSRIKEFQYHISVLVFMHQNARVDAHVFSNIYKVYKNVFICDSS